MESSHRKIHWFAPTLMVFGLLAGLLLAAGHHLFYHSLAGSAAPSGEYLIAGSHLSRQQLNIAVGTAFAFLVKAALVVAVGTAYTQAFWRALLRAEEGLPLKQLDTTHQAMVNILSLLKLRTWIHFPVLLLLVVIAWIIPIASIVTPATLSIVTAPISPAPISMLEVPQFDFTSLNYVSDLGSSGGPDYDKFCYTGPNNIVTQTAAIVGAQGEMLSITPPSSNSSWELEFNGPSLQCTAVEGSVRDQFWGNIWDFFHEGDNCQYSYGYLSWVPTANSSFPFVAATESNGTSARMTWQSPTSVGPFSASPSDLLPLSIYVALLPNMFNTVQMLSHVVPGACKMTLSSTATAYDPNDTEPESGTAWFFGNSTLLQCEVRNTTYNAGFNYRNNVQNINISLDSAQSTSVSAVECVTGPVLEGSSTAPGGGLSLSGGYLDCPTLNIDGTQCDFQPSVARTLSYQAITDAFNRLIIGTIGLDGTVISPNSSIMGTVLAESSNMAFISDWTSTLMTLAPLQSIAQKANNISEYRGLVNSQTTGSRGSLRNELETLFQNITISLLSQELLQANSSSMFAPSPLAAVSSYNYHPIYVYSASTLWVAYGLAVALAFFAVCLGLSSTFASGISYSDNFSSIVRVARAGILTKEIRAEESDGRDPLSKNLAQARMIVARGGANHLEATTYADKESPVVTTSLVSSH